MEPLWSSLLTLCVLAPWVQSFLTGFALPRRTADTVNETSQVARVIGKNVRYP